MCCLSVAGNGANCHVFQFNAGQCAQGFELGLHYVYNISNYLQEQVIHNMRAIKRGFKACFRCRSS